MNCIPSCYIQYTSMLPVTISCNYDGKTRGWKVQNNLWGIFQVLYPGCDHLQLYIEGCMEASIILYILIPSMKPNP